MFVQISGHKRKWPIKDTSDKFVATKKNTVTELTRQGSSWDDTLVKAWGWLNCSFLSRANCLKGMVSTLCLHPHRHTYSLLVIWDFFNINRSRSPLDILIYCYETNYPKPNGLKQQ